MKTNRRFCEVPKTNSPSSASKRKVKIIRISVAILIPVIFVLLLFYGPYGGFRNLLITTSMFTSDHKYIAKFFYSDAEIQRVLKENAVVNPSENSIPDNGIRAVGKHSSQIEYKEISNLLYKGYLIKVNDPSRVHIVACGNSDDKGLLLEQIVERDNAVAGINAGGYISNKTPGIPDGLVISDYKIISQCDENLHRIIALDKNNYLVLGQFSMSQIESLNLRDAVEFSPFLVVNGRESVIKGNGGGIAPRTAIGQTKDGTIILLVIDGWQVGSVGTTFEEVQRIMVENGAINAANLDGGSSASMYYENRIINNPCQTVRDRYLPTAVIVR